MTAHLWCLCFLSPEEPEPDPSSAYVYGIHWIFSVTLLGGRMLRFSHMATCSSKTCRVFAARRVIRPVR